MHHLNGRDIVTLIALGASLFALFRSYRLDKRDLFLRMHESLLGEPQMAGRRALGHITDEASAAKSVEDPEESTQVYRALAAFDVLGLYVDRGWVDRWTVLEEWADSLSKYAEPKRLWVAQRYPGKQFHSWPHYDDLSRVAAGYLDGSVRPPWTTRAWRDVRAVVRRTRHRGPLRP